MNLLAAIGRRLSALGAALAALVRLTGVGLAALRGSGSTLKERLTAAFTQPEHQRLLFTVLRALRPNLLTRRQLITSYANTGTALVTRFPDVLEVLSRDEDFAVVYGPRMIEITGGENFFLGMQNTAEYSRDVSNMRVAVRRDDVTARVQPFAARTAAELVAAAAGRIDVPQDLTLRVPAQLLGEYFGTPGPSERAMIEWTTVMFWYLFVDLNGDPEVGRRAKQAAAECRAYLDAAIQTRKATPTGGDDILNRCLAMQATGLPGMDDLGIRNNLIGLVIGAVPTTSKAAVQALDQLLDRADALAGAQRAARADDDAALASYVFEALIERDIIFAEYQITIEDGRNPKRVVPGGNLVPSLVKVAVLSGLRLQEVQPSPQIEASQQKK